jgi:hypothetical protein
MSDTWLQIVTGAPKELDDDGTLPLSDNFGSLFGFSNRMGKIVRLVVVQDRGHAFEQIKRYASQGYFVMRKQEWDSEMKLYPDFYTITENADYYHRESIDFAAAVNWGSELAIDHLTDAIERIQKYPNVRLESSDGGLSYLLTVQGSKDRFELIKAELRVAFKEGETIAQSPTTMDALREVGRFRARRNEPN